MIAVSACLMGLPCRYNGTGAGCERMWHILRKTRAVPVCPELAGGFGIPRRPVEIQGGTGLQVLEGKARVVDDAGEDVTEALIRGTEKTLGFLREKRITRAILKEYSPSCGVTRIHNGEFRGITVKGMGVTAALLDKHGIWVENEKGETMTEYSDV